MAKEYIEREAAIAAVDCTQVTVGDWIRNNIQKIPAADVAPVVRGRWINVSDFAQLWACSVCRKHTRHTAPAYCPNCGADMREVPHDN